MNVYHCSRDELMTMDYSEVQNDIAMLNAHGLIMRHKMRVAAGKSGGG